MILFAYGGLPLFFALAADSVGVKLSATANGFLFGVGLTLGGLIYPLAIGFIKDLTGTYTMGFIQQLYLYYLSIS